MENERRQQRLDLLRIHQAQGILTDLERAEMKALFAELDAEEAEAMRPALEHRQEEQAALQQEKEALAARAAHLERILADQKQLLAEARSYLLQLRTRRAALADEYRRATGSKLPASQ
jgi:uncharacterized protein (DUF3084 family)